MIFRVIIACLFVYRLKLSIHCIDQCSCYESVLGGLTALEVVAAVDTIQRDLGDSSFISFTNFEL
jgi:hypothetical protein